MSWKRALNRGLTRTTGDELRKPAVQPPARRRRRKPGEQPGDRLLKAPALAICSVRSGSTLLRALLNSHSKIHSPLELHVHDYAVRVKTPQLRAQGAARDRARR